MATYSERLEYKEEILPNQTIQLRTATIVERDGVEVGRQYHREVFHPVATSLPHLVKFKLSLVSFGQPKSSQLTKQPKLNSDTRDPGDSSGVFC